jgi:hypothetical protein
MKNILVADAGNIDCDRMTMKINARLTIPVLERQLNRTHNLNNWSFKTRHKTTKNSESIPSRE